MDANTLCTLLAERIDPKKFELRGLQVVFPDGEDPALRAVADDVIANYETLNKQIPTAQGIKASLASELGAASDVLSLREAVKKIMKQHKLI